MLLKDFCLEHGKWLIGGHDDQETKMIEWLFDTNPTLPFVLVRDSGQRDTEIYAYIADKQPSRIHNVTSE